MVLFKGNTIIYLYIPLQLWEPDGQDALLSQVSYIPTSPKQTCLVHVHPRREHFARSKFTQSLALQLREVLLFLQAL